MNNITIWGKVQSDPKILDKIAFIKVFEAKKIKEEWKYVSYSIKCFKNDKVDNISRAATFKKGDKIVVSGMVDGTDSFTTNDGEQRISIEVMAHRFSKIVEEESSYDKGSSLKVDIVQPTKDKAVVEDIGDEIPF